MLGEDENSTFEDSSKAESPEGKGSASRLDREAMFRRFKRWFLIDKRHSDDWRKSAENEFDYVAGRQWSAEDMAKLREQMRPIVAFNRIAPVISAVSGTEVTNRQEVRYLPRQPGDSLPDEMLTATAKWFRDECNGEDEESDAFFDTLVCGMGWTETRMDFESDRDGAPLLERCDPLEMYWDSAASKRNIEDARRVWRVKKVPLDEAKALVGDYDVDDDDFNAKWAAFD
ncbi:MAG: phage portal protein, partial [Methylocystaceae bacterium]|nr:phage portal protein [Methylocystaceae bacterium]